MNAERKVQPVLLCFDAPNWLHCEFWGENADFEFMKGDPFEALRASDDAVDRLVSAASNSGYELLVVSKRAGHSLNRDKRLQQRRDSEILNEKKGVCLNAVSFLEESFSNRGVRVVIPTSVESTDVLAAFAVANAAKFGVVVSRNRNFLRYNVPIPVCRNFTVRNGKLLLELSTMDNNDDNSSSKSNGEFRRMSRPVQPRLVFSKWRWCEGFSKKYRPSALPNGVLSFGTSSSSDRRMGSLHVLARPLRAALYAIIGEKKAIERLPEWSDEKEEVVWTVKGVDADPALTELLNDPLAVVNWLVERDVPVLDTLESWRAKERIFNTCALAAELVAVASQGAWTMHKCMELFSTTISSIKCKCSYAQFLESSSDSITEASLLLPDLQD